MPKRDPLCTLISSSSSNVILLTETWLTSNILDCEILHDLSDFDIFRKNHFDDNRGGGVAIATHRLLKCSAVNVKSSLEMVWTCCHATSPHMLIGCCYRPPCADSTFLSSFHEALLELTTTYPNTPVLLFGDFNFPSIDWSNVASCLAQNNMAAEFVNIRGEEAL